MPMYYKVHTFIRSLNVCLYRLNGETRSELMTQPRSSTQKINQLKYRRHMLTMLLYIQRDTSHMTIYGIFNQLELPAKTHT